MLTLFSEGLRPITASHMILTFLWLRCDIFLTSPPKPWFVALIWTGQYKMERPLFQYCTSGGGEGQIFCPVVVTIQKYNITLWQSAV